MRSILITVLLCITFKAIAQDSAKLHPRPMSLQEYDKAKTFVIKDLDNDTYVKFENKYILDRYEMRKPYFITGDDGLKKRVDMYKLVAKDGMHDLGTIIYYTNEKGKVYTALQPNFTADSKVWEKYFEDIHSVDKEEKNFVLKLSYILSKEMSFQLYKAINKGKDLKQESGTYGTDICFPGDQQVAMADGNYRLLKAIRPGDQIITIDPLTKKEQKGEVLELTSHEAKDYALTTLLLVSAEEHLNKVHLTAKVIQATPNHPVGTLKDQKKMGEVMIGDEIICFDTQSKTYKTFSVFNKTQSAGGTQKVYNMVVNTGTTFVMNGVVVRQK